MGEETSAGLFNDSKNVAAKFVINQSCKILHSDVLSDNFRLEGWEEILAARLEAVDCETVLLKIHKDSQDWETFILKRDTQTEVFVFSSEPAYGEDMSIKLKALNHLASPMVLTDAVPRILWANKAW